MERKFVAFLALTAIGVVVASHVKDVNAADHGDPSDRITLGEAADIGDLYAWHSDGTMKAVMTFGGPVAAGVEAPFSRDVLYAINIDGADEDHEPDHTIWFRFAQNGASEWGVWAEGLPGADADVVSPIDTVVNSGSASLYAGLRDDPFFFDLQGFQDTLSTGTLSFMADRDFFAGQNLNTIVVEFPIAELDFEGPYNFWVTTGTGS